MKFIVALLFALGLLIPSAPTVTQAADNCTFVLGFKALHDMIPAKVGNCLTNEYHNAQNGDGLQQTIGGLLVWRKADNWTAFTDGYRTWVNGPNGLQQRLNTERFLWENDGQARPAIQPIPTIAPLTGDPSDWPTPGQPAMVESRISGAFTGWSGETVFVLVNGQIWQQAYYNYHYHYAYSPRVLIYSSGGRWVMQVEGVSSTIYVTRIR